MLDSKLMESALGDIEILRRHLLAARDEVHSEHPRAQSLLNLNQYMLLRKKDQTQLQEKLFMLSLSSLGRSFAHVAASIDTLFDQLSSSLGREQISEAMMAEFHHLSIADALAIASRNSKALFGGKASSKLSKQITAVMVTLPSNAAENDGLLIRQLSDAGINVFRINTAHDDIQVWKAMADVIGTINMPRESSNKIKIFVDLSGPKIRTGNIQDVEMPIEIGSNKQEKEVIIYCNDVSTQGEYTDLVTLKHIPAQLSVEKKFFKKFRTNRPIKIVDVNHKKAIITLTDINETFARGFIDKKVFVTKKSKLTCDDSEGKLLNLVTQKDPIRLFINDHLIITENDTVGRSALCDDEGNVVLPAMIGCSLKGVLGSLKEGEKVFIDDGKIGLVILENRLDSILCKVVISKSNGTLLKEEKGINFPDTCINEPALTDTDRMNALNVLEFADSLSLSFLSKCPRRARSTRFASKQR